MHVDAPFMDSDEEEVEFTGSRPHVAPSPVGVPDAVGKLRSTGAPSAVFESSGYLATPGFENPLKLFCHLDAVLGMILTSPITRRDVARDAGDAATAWSGLLDLVEAHDGDFSCSITSFIGFLRETNPFSQGGIAIREGCDRNGVVVGTEDWFTKWQVPIETWARLCQVLQDVPVRMENESFCAFGDLVAVHRDVTLLSTVGCDAVLGSLQVECFVTARAWAVPTRGSEDGTWLLTQERETLDRDCPVCGTRHEFQRDSTFSRLPPMLVIDYGAAIAGAGTKRKQVTAPLNLRVPLGDGTVVHYQMHGFVRVYGNHAQAYVSAGAGLFKAYDDGDLPAWYRISSNAVKLQEWIAAAFYVQLAL
jgi:hypothetical protein